MAANWVGKDIFNQILSYGNAFRLRGYFEEGEFHLVGLAVYSWLFNPLYNLNEYSCAELDLDGRLQWEVVFDNSAEADRELVTIYTKKLNGYDAATSTPVTSNGRAFASLDALAQAQVAERIAQSGVSYEKESLWETIFVNTFSVKREDGTHFYTATALHCYPIRIAVESMWPFYFSTFLIIALAVFLLLRSIRNNLTVPVSQVVWSSNGNPAPLREHPPSHWREPYALEENYNAMLQMLHENKSKVTQLETALEFAQNAEAHRRQMVSNITHELKTPLAIIHSYAEGLQAGIAADKQEQYLNVILEEAQRMDAMVLEMLDLSRLEAGKVRLAADQFSLLGLTRSIFGKLEPMAKEKDLHIHYDLTEEFDITADEGRIGQVITNFATNAIKYTPEGGSIWVKVYRYKGKTWFTIENECEALPREALDKIWDSFYRAEASRTTKGTGLGLTIAKAIITLHGGTCQASNTSKGVEFKFILP